MPLQLDDGPKQPLKVPNFHDFAVQISRDAAYNRIRTVTANQVAANRLEAFFISEKEEWETIAVLWNAVIDATASEHRETEAERAGWNTLAETSVMPFSFDTEGHLMMAEDV